MLWWLLLAALGAVLIVAWQARSRVKSKTRRPGGPRPPGRPKAPPSKTPSPKAPPLKSRAKAQKPRPGEIWWADVPYEDYSGHKVRPCVVLRGRGGYRQVLKITSQDQSRRGDHVRIITRTWDPDADHDSYLDLTGPVRV